METGGASKSPLSAVILAGGRSVRLGTDKALIPWLGRPLIETVLDRVSRVAADLIAVTNAPDLLEHLPARLVPDVVPGAGSLGGILSGLLAATNEHSLVVACDMPFLDVELLRHMAALSREYDVLVPHLAEGIEPLHAIYSNACIEPIREVVNRGGRRIVEFFPRVRVRYIEQEVIDRFDPHHLSFFNINTPEDLERALRLSE